jgi:uncharacterized membrane protein YdcZ (DUF606 family)
MGVSKDYATRLELLVLATWLTKDFAWVLVLAPLAWPAALVAICLEAHNLMIEWKAGSAAIRAHGLAALAWLTGNATWMSAELLFDNNSAMDQAKQPLFPWHSGPIAGSLPKAYNEGVLWAQIQFSIGLLILLFYYVGYASGALSSSPSQQQACNPQDEDSLEDLHEEGPLVFGVVTPAVYASAFIGPWILKDLFWTMELLVPAILCGLLTMALAFDAFRRFHFTTSGIEVLWVLANIFWIYGEIGVRNHAWPRIVAAAILSCGCGVALTAYWKVVMNSDEEYAHLIN